MQRSSPSSKVGGAAERSYPAAERSYPTPKVRGSRQEELPQAPGQGLCLRGGTPCPRSGAAAGRSYPNSTPPVAEKSYPNPTPPVAERSYPKPTPEAGAAAERSYPTYKEQRLLRCRRPERRYSTFNIRRGSREELLLIQGKRNPSKTVGVARGHQRAGALKP